MRRRSLRLRLTIAFALAMAAVLAAVAVLLYVRLGATLSEQLDESLVGRAKVVTAAVAGGGIGQIPLDTGGDEDVAQLLAADGAVVGGAAASREPLLTDSERARARDDAFFVTREALPALAGERARLRASRAGELVLVVGASLEERDEALAGLTRELALVLPLALVVATGAGYLLAAAALRPVEAMRRRAAAITSDNTSDRLPVGSADDEIARLGMTLNDMLGRLEDGLARERRFVADASHELRTPLALLQTELELALRRPRSRQELESAVRSAAAETERLSRLAQDLLVLATAERGALPVRLEDFAADDLLGAVVRRFSAQAADEGRELVARPTRARIRGDRLRLEQAVGNLVDNAFRHGAGSVRLGAEALDGVVELRVSDDGAGIAPAFAARAFSPFTRGDAARAGAGAGLGLAIVEAIARAHGGAARIEVDDGDGASVVVELPCGSR